jgi:hypothetical protein
MIELLGDWYAAARSLPTDDKWKDVSFPAQAQASVASQEPITVLEMKPGGRYKLSESSSVVLRGVVLRLDILPPKSCKATLSDIVQTSTVPKR